MLMWIASLFVSLFHESTTKATKPVHFDKSAVAQALPADQSVLDVLAKLLSDGTHYP